MIKPAIVAGLLIVLSACGTADSDDTLPTVSLIPFDSTDVAIVTAADTVRIKAEVADSDEERGYGLMDRARLDENSGMLFVYDAPQDSTYGFYMFRTRIPLDIAFADSAGVILTILAMEPCEHIQPSNCRSYNPGVGYTSALEVNRGFFAQHGITPGARILWPH
ncbi:MAG: DUF192 domain-containing protein [Gemmatimonadota bacterium]